ncbi:MAG: polysaccharide deacetylase family protein [Proteobacteria bacterium]|nr:polysaccharide deacetylase family protein [Pseudomonadota bacterium]
MTTRARGMDHGHYPFSPLPARPALGWPNGARVAFWVLLHLEYWELDPPQEAVRDARFVSEFGNFFPDYRTWSQREYGNRVGIFRILEVLDRHRIKATVAANAAACTRYPFLVGECRRRGYEFTAHGSHATRMITSRMTESEERAAIAESIAAVARAAGSKPTGWLGQDFGETERTPRLLAEAGLDYVMDWANDDQPYRMTVGRPFVAIPGQLELDDIQLFWIRRVNTWRYPDLVDEAFATLHEEGAASGRSFGLSLHPWLFGMAQRIRYLDEALRRLAAYRDVWQTTAGDIAAWYLQQSSGRKP